MGLLVLIDHCGRGRYENSVVVYEGPWGFGGAEGV